jgi:FMN-dependent NADH-azoreductase
MKDILFVNACVRKDSRTLELAKHVLSKVSGEVEEIRLYEMELNPLDLNGLKIRDEAKINKDFSNSVFDLAKQFAGAETIVIATPYWDLMFPTVLKNYLEMITVAGLTFVYGENGFPKGLCNAKKLIYVTTSGGPIIYNFGYDYVSTIAKTFFGINDTIFVSAQKLDIQGSDVSKILEEAKKSFNL